MTDFELATFTSVAATSEATTTILSGPTPHPNQLGCDWYKFVVDTWIIGMVCILGFIGNTFSCIIFWPSINTNATTLILFTLALFDNLILVIHFIMKSVPALMPFTSSHDYYTRFIWPYKSGYIWTVGSICHMFGSWVVLLVTVHRYVAVCHPLRAKSLGKIKWARIQVSVLIIGSIIFYIPQFALNSVERTEERARVVAHDTSQAYTVGYKVVAYYLLIYVIPFTCLIFMTARLLYSLRKARMKRERMTRTKRDEDDITRTLVVVVIVFMICQLTNPIRRALAAVYKSHERGCGSVYFYYNEFSSLVVVTNSAVNFLIYYHFGQRFRKQLQTRVFRRARVEPMETSTFPKTMQNDSV